MKQVLFTAADGLVLLRRHHSSEISHQHVIEFFFLLGALIVTPGLCVLLLLVLLRVNGAPGLLVVCGSVAPLCCATACGARRNYYVRLTARLKSCPDTCFVGRDMEGMLYGTCLTAMLPTPANQFYRPGTALSSRFASTYGCSSGPAAKILPARVMLAPALPGPTVCRLFPGGPQLRPTLAGAP
jgi:hypothetical protein